MFKWCTCCYNKSQGLQFEVRLGGRCCINGCDVMMGPAQASKQIKLKKGERGMSNTTPNLIFLVHSCMHCASIKPINAWQKDSEKRLIQIPLSFSMVHSCILHVCSCIYKYVYIYEYIELVLFCHKKKRKTYHRIYYAGKDPKHWLIVSQRDIIVRVWFRVSECVRACVRVCGCVYVCVCLCVYLC